MRTPTGKNGTSIDLRRQGNHAGGGDDEPTALSPWPTYVAAQDTGCRVPRDPLQFHSTTLMEGGANHPGMRARLAQTKEPDARAKEGDIQPSRIVSNDQVLNIARVTITARIDPSAEAFA